ncbi:hypothetical protein Tco_0476101 [Tanacetum coccineum]
MPEQVGVGEFSPPYYISQLGDSLIISGSFGFGAFRIIYAWALDFEDGIISSCNLLFTILHPAGHFLKLLGFSNANEPIVEAEIVQQCTHVEPSPYTTNPVTIIPGPSGVVHVSSSTRVEPSTSNLNPVRIIPGPAGLGSQARLAYRKMFLSRSRWGVNVYTTYMDKVIEDVQYTGTIHPKVIGKGGYGKDITVGAAMILTNVSVFSPNPSKHYLNITMRNVVEVFRKDTVLGNVSG